MPKRKRTKRLPSGWTPRQRRIYRNARAQANRRGLKGVKAERWARNAARRAKR